MTKTSELDPKRNEHHRKWTQFNRESILIILVSICVIVTTGNHFRTNNAIDSANKASAQGEIWQTMYKEAERDCKLLEVSVHDFEKALIRAGIDYQGEPH